jgi:predicted nuclease of predicted toxin-antitoxin system
VSTVNFLRNRGNDVIHALEQFSGVADDVLLAFAREESRIVLTFDLDFDKLVFRDRLASAPGVVLFRVEQFPPKEMLETLQRFFESGRSLRGWFTVVTETQIRQTALPEV